MLIKKTKTKKIKPGNSVLPKAALPKSALPKASVPALGTFRIKRRIFTPRASIKSATGYKEKKK